MKDRPIRHLLRRLGELFKFTKIRPIIKRLDVKDDPFYFPKKGKER